MHIEHQGADSRAIFALSGLVFGEVIGHSLERLFWLSWHGRVGCAALADIAFHQAVARHVEIVSRVYVVRESRRDKREHKGAVKKVARLQAFVSDVSYYNYLNNFCQVSR